MKFDKFHSVPTAVAAIIYVRVSDAKQDKDGHGSESQEFTCTVHADKLGLEVKATFRLERKPV